MPTEAMRTATGLPTRRAGWGFARGSIAVPETDIGLELASRVGVPGSMARTGDACLEPAQLTSTAAAQPTATTVDHNASAAVRVTRRSSIDP
jgi:hypothetical protein